LFDRPKPTAGCSANGRRRLTLILLTWRIWWAPNNVVKWQMGFNLAFKGLRTDINENYSTSFWLCFLCTTLF
jgi:hypothetical protein